MTFGGTSFTNFAGALGRTFIGGRGADNTTDTTLDQHDDASAFRADIEAMLAEDMDSTDATAQEAVTRVKLRASEQREHDTMCLIRGALYPAD